MRSVAQHFASDAGHGVRLHTCHALVTYFLAGNAIQNCDPIRRHFLAHAAGVQAEECRPAETGWPAVWPSGGGCCQVDGCSGSRAVEPGSPTGQGRTRTCTRGSNWEDCVCQRPAERCDTAAAAGQAGKLWGRESLQVLPSPLSPTMGLPHHAVHGSSVSTVQTTVPKTDSFIAFQQYAACVQVGAQSNDQAAQRHCLH